MRGPQRWFYLRESFLFVLAYLPIIDGREITGVSIGNLKERNKDSSTSENETDAEIELLFRPRVKNPLISKRMKTE